MILSPHNNQRLHRMAAQARRAVLGCALASLAVLAMGQTAVAQGVVACDGVVRNFDHSIGPLQTGDVITSIQRNNDLAFAGFRQTVAEGSTYIVAATENGQTVRVELFLPGVSQIKCNRPVAATPATPTTTTATSTPTPTTAAQTSVTVQSSVTQSAINTNVAGRFGQGAGLSANSSGLTVSTRGLDKAASDLGEPELNAWVGIEGRRFSGTTTGDSRNLSFGLDRLVTPNLVIGGYVSYNDQTATVGGATTATKSPLFGAYAANKLNNGLFVSGFVGYGRPEYTIGTTSFTATRRVLGASMSGEIQAGGLRLTPLASLLSSTEDLPAAGAFAADRLDNTQASLSVRVEPAQRFANGILPYATLGAEYRRQGSNLVAYDSFTKPRLGLGFNWQLAAGSLRFDLDYGNITSTANDMGASLVYDFKF